MNTLKCITITCINNIVIKSKQLCRKCYDKAYKTANAFKKKLQDKAYCDANALKRSKTALEWKKANIERTREIGRKRRALKANVISEPYTNKEILERDNYTCQICFEPIPDLPKSDRYNYLYLNIDHIVALWAGGSDTKDNVRATHRVCNIMRTKEQEEKGL